MADTGYRGGIPQREPGRAPDVYNRVMASPDAAGAAMGRAMQSFAGSVERAGKNVQSTLDYYDDVAADDALNKYQERATKLLHGETIEGQHTPGFLSMQGQNALRARPDIEKQFDQFEKELLSGLKSQRAQQLFQTAANRYKRQSFAKIGEHSDREFITWSKGVNLATEKEAISAIAFNADNDIEYRAQTQDLINARVKNLELDGFGSDPVMRRSAIAEAKQLALKTRVEAMAVRDPVRAREFVEKNRADAGVLYDDLWTKTNLRAEQQIGIGIFEAALGGARAAPATQPAQTPQAPEPPDAEATPEQVSDAIIQQESGGREDIGTSTAGAVGIGQILPSTFARYAKPGERIDNPADNRAVSQRIVQEYMRKYDGDPARVAVAYFSGEGNVAPEGSETPWLRDTADTNGKTVSSYVNDIVGRLGGPDAVRPKTGVRAQKASVFESILARTDITPQAKQYALSSARTYFEVKAAQEREAEQELARRRSAFTSTFEIQLSRGQKSYADIEYAWQNGMLTDEKRTQLTLQLDRDNEKSRTVTQEIGRVTSAFNGGAPMDPKSTDDKKAVDLHYEMLRTTWKDLPAPEVMTRAISYATQVGIAPTPLKNMIRGNLRSGNAQSAVIAADVVQKLNNANPQILNDFSEDDLELAFSINTYSSYGVPPEKAMTDALDAMKVSDSERKNRRAAYDLELGNSPQEREKAQKKWLEDKLDNAWTVDPTLNPIMQAEWDSLVRSEYERTGNLETARTYALTMINRVWGSTDVGGSRRYMKYGPEKLYGIPVYSPAENAKWMNEQLISEIRQTVGVKPDAPLGMADWMAPQEPAKAEPAMEDTPLTRVLRGEIPMEKIHLTVDPSRIGPKGKPVYQVSIIEDGVMWPIGGKDGQPMRWIPDWETSAEYNRYRAREEGKIQKYGERLERLRHVRSENLDPTKSPMGVAP